MSRKTKQCPGGCGIEIYLNEFMCGGCLKELQKEMREVSQGSKDEECSPIVEDKASNTIKKRL